MGLRPRARFARGWSSAITSKVLTFSYYLYCPVTSLARCLHVLIPIKMLVEMDTKKLTFTYSNVLSEIVIAGRFLSKLCTCDIWLVDSNIVFVFFELSARWESLDQEFTVFSVEFSSCAHVCSSGAGQLEYIVVSSAYMK